MCQSTPSRVRADRHYRPPRRASRSSNRGCTQTVIIGRCAAHPEATTIQATHEAPLLLLGRNRCRGSHREQHRADNQTFLHHKTSTHYRQHFTGAVPPCTSQEASLLLASFIGCIVSRIGAEMSSAGMRGVEKFSSVHCARAMMARTSSSPRSPYSPSLALRAARRAATCRAASAASML